MRESKYDTAFGTFANTYVDTLSIKSWIRRLYSIVYLLCLYGSSYCLDITVRVREHNMSTHKEHITTAKVKAWVSPVSFK